MDASGTLKFGAVHVDLDAQMVRTPSGAQPLTTLEARLLAFLRDQQGATVPRRRLLREVWGYASSVESRAVDHSIWRLRRKIELDPTRPVFLKAVRGAGYRLEPEAPAPLPPPQAVDPLVGRSAEIGALVTALDQGRRLVTLHGPAGIGKTRLCREVLARHVTSPPHAIAWLLDARSASDVVRAVTRALDMSGLDSGDPARDREHLGEVLRLRGPLVLALDNAEHLVDEVRSCVSGWLAAAPELSIVITSRRPLGLPDEQILELAPLDPDDAVELMIHRARATRGHYDPTLEDREVLAQIATEQLDGLPLALELAGGRLGLLDAAGLRDRLGERLPVLRGSSRAGWTSLGDALRWSWDLATDVERSVLAQCTVFAGGFGMAAAEAVVDAGEHWVVDVIERLIGSALLQRAEADPPRVELLQSVRALATELGDPGEARERHRRWCAARAATLADQLSGPDGPEAARQLLDEAPDLRAAHADALRAADREALVPLAIALHGLTRRRGPDRDGLTALLPALELLEVGSPEWVELAWRAAEALRLSHRYDESRALLREAIESARTGTDRAKAACSLLPLASELGDAEAFEEAASITAATGDERRQFLLLQNQSVWEWAHGSLDRAAELGDEVLRRVEGTGDVFVNVACLAQQMLVAMSRGEARDALAFADRGLMLARMHDLPKYEIYLGVNAAQIQIQLDDLPDALARFEEAIALTVRMGDLHGLHWARLPFVEALIEAGDLDRAEQLLDELTGDRVRPQATVGQLALLRGLLLEARALPQLAEPHLREALKQVRENTATVPLVLAEVFAHLAALLADRGDVAEAEALLAEADEHLAGRSLRLCEQLLDAARVRLLGARGLALRRQADELDREAEALRERLGEAPRDVARLLPR